MKKKVTALLLAVVMCMTLTVPVMGIESDSNGVMPCEDMDGCLAGHTPPAGFTYEGYRQGNAIWDAVVTGGLISFSLLNPVTGLYIDKVLTITSALEGLVSLYQNGRLRILYYEYTYVRGNELWYHTIWYYYNEEGHMCQLTCATNSIYVGNK